MNSRPSATNAAISTSGACVVFLVLHERKAWIKLYDDSPVRHCLYWNLEDQHPVMRLTERVKAEKQEAGSALEDVQNPEEPGKKAYNGKKYVNLTFDRH